MKTIVLRCKSLLLPAILLLGAVVVTTVALSDPGGSSNNDNGRFDQSRVDQSGLAIAPRMVNQDRIIFRFDTYGDEAFWIDKLPLHQAIDGVQIDGLVAVML